MKFARYQRGFTLLEIMFVLILLTLVTVLTMQNYAKRDYNRRVARSVIQYQQIYEAAQSYYVDNGGQWPKGVAKLMPDYLPQFGQSQRILNPWGEPYHFSVAGGGSPVQPRESSLEIRSDYLSLRVANEIASQLPRATVTQSGHYFEVQLRVAHPRPNNLNDPERIQLTETLTIGGRKPTRSVPMPTCQPGYSPTISYGFSGFEAYRTDVRDNTKVYPALLGGQGVLCRISNNNYVLSMWNAPLSGALQGVLEKPYVAGDNSYLDANSYIYIDGPNMRIEDVCQGDSDSCDSTNLSYVLGPYNKDNSSTISPLGNSATWQNIGGTLYNLYYADVAPLAPVSDFWNSENDGTGIDQNVTGKVFVVTRCELSTAQDYQAAQTSGSCTSSSDPSVINLGGPTGNQSLIPDSYGIDTPEIALTGNLQPTTPMPKNMSRF